MNRNKAPLALMGQLLVVLFFAISAAICLQAFAKSEVISEASENRDHASRACQNVAEALISVHGSLEDTASLTGGSVSGNTVTVSYDKDWNVSSEGIYLLTATPVDSGEDGLGKGTVSVAGNSGEVLFSLECAWQEGLE